MFKRALLLCILSLLPLFAESQSRRLFPLPSQEGPLVLEVEGMSIFLCGSRGVLETQLPRLLGEGSSLEFSFRNGILNLRETLEEEESLWSLDLPSRSWRLLSSLSKDPSRETSPSRLLSRPTPLRIGENSLQWGAQRIFFPEGFDLFWCSPGATRFLTVKVLPQGFIATEYDGTLSPLPPLDLKASLEKNNSLYTEETLVEITWKNNPRNGKLLHYSLYRREGGKDSPWALLARVSPATFTYWDRDLDPAKASLYDYGVTVTDITLQESPLLVGDGTTLVYPHQVGTPSLLKRETQEER